MSQTTYKDAGVDLELYQQAMDRLPGFLKRTESPRVMPLPGGFAGLFRLNGDRRSYDDPVLVSGTDGVGTKIKVARAAGRFDTIGIDLVAMCVNDCLCCGAEPLFFLDYIALSEDDPDRVAAIVDGVSRGCVIAKAALLGGETAVMPGVYSEGEFDLAGFCVGVVERTRLIDGEAIQPGDVILGLESSGLHSNGFSLVRKIVFEIGRHKLDEHVTDLHATIVDVLLEPTRIYTNAVSDLLNHYCDEVVVSGIAHVTGGGIAENLERILPNDRKATIDRNKWNVPAIFHWLSELGQVDREEMFRVFNMGVGMLLIVRRSAAKEVRERLAAQGVPSHRIGKIAEGPRTVEMTG